MLKQARQPHIYSPTPPKELLKKSLPVFLRVASHDPLGGLGYNIVLSGGVYIFPNRPLNLHSLTYILDPLHRMINRLVLRCPLYHTARYPHIGIDALSWLWSSSNGMLGCFYATPLVLMLCHDFDFRGERGMGLVRDDGSWEGGGSGDGEWGWSWGYHYYSFSQPPLSPPVGDTNRRWKWGWLLLLDGEKEKAVIVHHYCQFVSPADSDNHPIITDSYHQPVVKIIITKALYYKLAVITTIKLITFSNQVRWRTLYQNCRSRWDLQLYSWWLFHLKSLAPKFSLVLIFWNSLFFKLYNLGWKIDQNQSCRTWWQQ
jgi:hypothetical protein